MRNIVQVAHGIQSMKKKKLLNVIGLNMFKKKYEGNENNNDSTRDNV